MFDYKKYIFFDIETITQYNNIDKLTELELIRLTKYRDNSKTPEIDLQEFYFTKGSLYPEFARIISIVMCRYHENKNNPEKSGMYYGSFPASAGYDDDEKTMLLNFQKSCLEKLKYKTTEHQLKGKPYIKYDDPVQFLCGFNIAEFDIPMLCRRMLINGIQPPPIFASYGTKPWEDQSLDLMKYLNHPKSYSKYPPSLDMWCEYFAIPTPKDGDVNGKNLNNYFWNGEESFTEKMDKIVEYCTKDVDVTFSVFNKIVEMQKQNIKYG